MSDVRRRMETVVRAAQEEICAGLEALGGGSFREDLWQHPEGGGGRSRMVQEDPVFDKAGVNVAAVEGTLGPDAARAMAGGTGPAEAVGFAAVGLSVVVHPRHPLAPIAHCNVRYFELADGRWWFGGGADLTPTYLFAEDAGHFHRTLREVCDRHDPAWYPRFKRWCDDYFFLPHRGEHRGIGGIFFDELADRPASALLAFAGDVASAFLPAYRPLLERRLAGPAGERERRWQLLRRGRYVEFNLMYDRGTAFGLRSGGRVESILMSLPLEARWEYGATVEVGSPEAATLEVLRRPQEWA